MVPQDPLSKLVKDLDSYSQKLAVSQDELRSQYQGLMKNDLSKLVRATFDTTLNEFVLDPYKSLIDDYIEKQASESELFDERVNQLTTTSHQ